MNRRDFVKTGSLASAALATTQSLQAQDTVAANEIHIALVGCGEQGRVLKDAGILIPGVKFKAVCDIWAFNRDYTLVLGTVILYAVLIMALNLVVDVVQAWLNPKVRLEG